MTEDEIESAKELFKLLFKHSADGLAQLAVVATRISDDAKDVRPVLRAAIDGASHPKTRDSITVVAADYERAIEALSDCAGRIRELIEFFKAGDYRNRLGRLRSLRPEDIGRDRFNAMLAAAGELNDAMTTRHSDWSLVLISFANLVRGIDGAQAALLKRPSWVERMIKLLPTAIVEGIGAVVPGFGFLVELAKSQEPHVDQLIEKISRATSVLDQLYAFGDLLSHQIELAGVTSERVSEAAAFEQQFLTKFNDLFGP